MYPVHPVKSPPVHSASAHCVTLNKDLEHKNVQETQITRAGEHTDVKATVLLQRNWSSAQSRQKCKGALLKSAESAGRVVREQNINCFQRSW